MLAEVSAAALVNVFTRPRNLQRGHLVYVTVWWTYLLLISG
jgi:hypothetical protein